MGEIIVSENVSLDGATGDPRGDEGLGRGTWVDRLGAAARDAWYEALVEETEAASALLMGRRTFEFFGAQYPTRTGRLADRMNRIPKYVVSTTLPDAERWAHTRVLTGDVVASVAELKRQTDGPIVVYASGGLVPTLLDHGLADELRLAIYPFVLGAGPRFVAATERVASACLLEHRSVGGMVFLTYRFGPEGGTAP